MPTLRAAAGTLLLTAFTVFGTGCSLGTMGQASPSSWAVTWPDTSPVSSGRIVRFAGSYGLNGPSPAFVYRDVDGQVSGQMLVWYRRFDPMEAGGRSAADSAQQWGRMQAAMTADRQRLDSLYGCTSWVKGYQDGRAWVCRVPPKHGPPNWVAELQSLDSLILAQPRGGVGRRERPVIQPPPPDRPGVTPYRPRAGACMDGGSWSIEVRDTRGIREYTAPNPAGACPQPDGPEKQYAAAGWTMLQKFIAAVR